MSGPYLVWVAGVGWDRIRGTDRHLVAALTRHARVLWVDPPVSPLTPAWRRGAAGRLPVPQLSEVDDRVTRLTPVALPGLTRRGIRVSTWPLVRAQLRWALRRLRVRPYAVVAASLDDVLGRWGADVRDVLFGTDDYVAGAELMRQDATRLRRQERRALRRADVVVAVSPGLRDRWAAVRQALGRPGDPVLVPNGCNAPNGCDPDLASSGLAGSELAGLDLAGPVVGLVGHLSERIDMGMLEAVADTGLTLLIVGPHDPRWEPQRFAALAGRPTVHYAGWVPTDAVAGYLAAIDVGITPYRDTPFNRASFPLKTLEYLAAGKSVVSTDLPAAHWLADDLAAAGLAAAGVLALAAGPDQMAAAVRAAAALGHSPELSARRRAFAARHSWPRRAEAFAAAIGLAARDSSPTRPVEV